MSVFNLIQGEMKKNMEAVNLERQQELAASKAKKSEPESKKRTISEICNEIGECVPAKKVKTNEEVKENEKEKKTKNKQSKNTDVDINNKENGEIQNTSNVSKDVQELTLAISEKKKKKKNKKKSLDVSETENVPEEKMNTNGIGGDGTETLTNGTSKKKKNKKKHSQSGESNAVAEEVKTEPEKTVLDELNVSTVSTHKHKSPKKKSKWSLTRVVIHFIYLSKCRLVI